jgi:hypothetical protein
MLGLAVSRRLVALALSLLLLLTQQWGTLHALSHGLHGGDPASAVQTAAPDDAPARHAATADAGDALCQVCLVLAALGAASLPALWRWQGLAPRAAAPLAPRPVSGARRTPAPWQARAPPLTH